LTSSSVSEDPAIVGGYGAAAVLLEAMRRGFVDEGISTKPWVRVGKAKELEGLTNV